MMVPSIWGKNLFDSFMDDFAYPEVDKAAKHANNLMKTDVKETDTTYEVDIDLPGFKKDEIKMQLQDGYLTIAAQRNVEKDDKNKDGKYIRRERFSGSVSRSFYVGEDVKQEDIHAKYENGILSFTLPKQEQRKAIEEKNHYIAIEG
ncbi:MAG: Hsp20/alpha crystallin family protein [Oscillospiraceae bacterium]|nr:Hsp20/alpha crystallin family protein [Oscillospiraceae bacterium]